MSVYDLPTSLSVGGQELKIRSDYRAVLDICAALSDPELNERDRAAVLLMILYEDYKTAAEYAEEAIQRALWFIGCGDSSDGQSSKPKLMDWEQDFPILVGAVNRVAGTEIRSLPYLHWWTFVSYYMEIGDCTFAQVVSIRNKQKRHKKLEDWEKEYYKENKSIIDMKSSHVSQTEMEELAAMLGIELRQG